MAELYQLETYKGLPLGKYEKYSPDKKKGLVIIIGQIFEDDPNFNLTNILVEGISHHEHQNILYLNYAGKETSLDELHQDIETFAAKHQEVSIFSAMHGFQVWPNREHETAWGRVEVGTTPGILDYLFSDTFISTTDYLKTIAAATASVKLNLWLETCQSNTLIPTIKEVFNEDTVVYTASDGFHVNPGSISGTLAFVLYNNHITPSFFDMLKVNEYESQSRSISSAIFNYNRIKTSLDKNSVEDSSLASAFLKLAHDKLSDGTFEEWKCKLSSKLKRLCENFNFDLLESTASKENYNQIDATKCFAAHGVYSYIEESFAPWAKGWEGPYQPPEECNLTSNEFANLLYGATLFDLIDHIN